ATGAAPDEKPAADQRGAGACRCGRNQVELAIVLDLSGSMGLSLNTCKAVMEKIVDTLDASSSANLRVGMVCFRCYDDPEFKIKTLGLTSDRRELVDFMQSLKADGGGDECGAEAMQEAVHRLHWSKGARKVIVYISDEAVIPEKTALFRQQLIDGRDQGIAIHFITPSTSAWQFFLSDDPERAKRLVAADPELPNTFHLPMWDASAALTGGISVGFSNIDALSRWMLAFTLGLDQEEAKALNVKQFFLAPTAAAAQPTEEDDKPHAPPVLGQLQNAADWNADHAYGALWRQVKARIDIDADSAVERVTPDSPNLAKLPLLYWSLHTASPFDAAQQDKLAKYMQNGGLIWADACCSSLAFEKSMLAWIDDLKRSSSHYVWRRIAADHAVFHTAYDLDTVRTRPWAVGLLKERTQWPLPEDDAVAKFVARPPEAWGLFDDGRLCLIYTPYDLGAAWKPLPFQSPCGMKIEDALRLSTNIVVYAMNRGAGE
ncbi:MAG: DUF4159 domain-containing protein, partial [Planctomycetota bacterium]